MEDFDRKITEANRRTRESRERCHRLNVLLEECRACVAKMLDRVGCDASVIAGVVADLAALDAEAAEAAALADRRSSVQQQGANKSALALTGSRRRSDDIGAVVSSSTAAAASPSVVRRHERIVSAEQLEAALATLEQRIGQLLAHLAGVFEREEVLVATTAKAKGTGAAGERGLNFRLASYRFLLFT